MIDLIIWLIGDKPEYVFAEGNKIGTDKRMKYNSFVILNLIFRNKLIVKITGNGPCVHPHFHKLTIFGTKKTFTHDYSSSKYFSKNKIQNFSLKESVYPAKKTRSKIIESFIEGVIHKKPNLFIADTKSVYDIMDICFAAEESMFKEKRIKIKYTI